MIGTQIGSWIIESHLGKGGMGQVYRARHKTLDTLAAVKVLAPTLDEEEFRHRFFQEAKTQAHLRHPNIAHVLDYLEQDGKWFLVVEYMERGSLADRLPTDSRPLPVLGAITYSRQALSGLGHAHQHGVVHRDVKPANLLLNERDEVAVTDFGIAKVEGEHRLTGTGLSLGTPRYMSPEQITDPKGVDYRCDIYSMGIVLYQLLLGRVPFESGSDFEILRAQVYESPPPMRQLDPGIAPALERIVLRALAKQPEERYTSCTEFTQALTSWLAEGHGTRAPALAPPAAKAVTGEEATQVSPAAAAAPHPAAKSTPPSRGWFVATALGTVLLLGGVAAFRLLRDVPPGPRLAGGTDSPVEEADSVLRAAATSGDLPNGPSPQQVEPGAPARPVQGPSDPARPGIAAARSAQPPAGNPPSLPSSPTALPPVAHAPGPAVAGRSAPTLVTPAAPGSAQPLRTTPRVLVVGIGEPALAAAAQDALTDGLAGAGDVLSGRGVPALADRLDSGAATGILELLSLARAAGADVLVLADARPHGEEVRSSVGGDFVALTSRLEISAFLVASGESLGSGWSAAVRYAPASAATYGGRAIQPLLPAIADGVTAGWGRLRESGS